MTIHSEIVLLAGARTPIGRFRGGLSGVSATDLGVVAARAAIERAEVDAATIDAVVFGNVIQTSADAVYLARHVGLRAGAPIAAHALTLNRLCASGLEAIRAAARMLLLGEARLCLVGGAENMSAAPFALRGARQPQGLGEAQHLEDTLAQALYDPEAGCTIGETLEHVAQTRGITREEADAVALWSQQRAAAAQERGRLAVEITPVQTARGEVSRDEHPRPETTAEGLAALRPLYRPDGVITAGNASGLNDAAAALLVTTADFARAHGLTPLGRLRASWAAGVPPLEMGLGAVPAARGALEHAGLTLPDVDVIELNDAFAVQHIAIERALGFDRERATPNGGCLALGHPMAATGARLALSMLHELRTRDLEFGLITLPVGGGQGVAAILERGD